MTLSHRSPDPQSPEHIPVDRIAAGLSQILVTDSLLIMRFPLPDVVNRLPLLNS
jgi:hypothetical protein